MSKITIKEIAKIAGVANSTVTNALNPNSKKISEAKRAEILKIVEEFNYIPSKSAQLLSGKNTKRVGFFVRSSDHFSRGIVDQKLIYYMNKFAHENKLELITIITSYDQEKSFEEIKNQIDTYNLTHVVIQGLDNDLEILSELIKLDTKKILIELPVTNSNTVFISTDNFKAQFELTEMIIKKHQIKNPLYISGTLDAYVSHERLSGYKEACTSLNVPFNFKEASFDKEIASKIISNIDLSSYDYISCGSDIIAGIVAKQCIAKNPNAIISGFDGDDFLSFFDNKIYTINQDIKSLCDDIITMIYDDNLETKLLNYSIDEFN